MVYKCGPNKIISSLSINPAAELIEMRHELKIHNIQIIANDFNGSNSLCFRKAFLIFFRFFFSPFRRLKLPKDNPFWFCSNFLVIYQGIFSQKLMIFKTSEIS